MLHPRSRRSARRAASLLAIVLLTLPTGGITLAGVPDDPAVGSGTLAEAPADRFFDLEPGDEARPELAPDRYFVAFRGAMTATDVAELVDRGIEVRQQFPELHVAAVEVKDAGLLAALRAHPRVEYVEQEAMRYALDLFSAQLVPAAGNGLYGLLSTQADIVQSRGVTGTGINVGVADTSLDYTHPDIAPNYRGGIDIAGKDNDPINDDGQTHGTHVAGTILAANDSQGVVGMAYTANLYHARVLGSRGTGSSADIMAGVRWLVETAGCKVVNLSLGGGARSQTEEQFYAEMRDKGALIVCASGNENATRISFPAGYATNIAVGAVDRSGARASFSNRGTNLDVVAPGVGVLSSVPRGRGVESSVTLGMTYAASGMTFAARTPGTIATLVDCGTGLPGEFPSEVAGNIALIQRGINTFSEKVTDAMDAGAVAAIVYNSSPEDFTGTLGSTTASGGRPWIPVLAISGAAGKTLKSQTGSLITVLNKTSDWASFSGTSMATPHVTGAIALIWSANPALSNASVEELLFSTCSDLGPEGYDTTFGWGLINVNAAVAGLGR